MRRERGRRDTSSPSRAPAVAFLLAAVGAGACAGGDLSGVALGPPEAPPGETPGPGPEVPRDELPRPAEPEDFLSLLDLAPSRGLTTGLEEVTITGTMLTTVDLVRFGDSWALDWFALSDELGIALAPPRPAGYVDLFVTDVDTGAEAVLESAYLYRPPVELFAITPPDGDVRGGEPVTLTGSGFTPDSEVVLGGRKALSVTFVDETTLHALTPEADGVGPASVFVTSPAGVGHVEEGFLYRTPPSITSVWPPVATTGVPTSIELTGGGLLPPLSVSVAGAGVLGVVPGGPDVAVFDVLGEEPGLRDVVVDTPWGEAVAKGALAFAPKTWAGEALEIASVFPAAGPVHGGTIATLLAPGLDPSPAPLVTVGGVPAEVLNVAPALHALVFLVPPAEGPGPAEVVLVQGDLEAKLGLGFTYFRAPRIHTVEPGFGPAGGGTHVVVRGTGFGLGATAFVGPLAAADVVLVDDETLELTTPPGSPGPASVTVVSDGRPDTVAGAFLYTAPPEVWVVDPPSGAVAGGSLVRVLGSGFSEDVVVRFDGVPATGVTLLGPTVLEVRTPKGEVGPADVSVLVKGAPEHLRENAFTYFDPAGLEGSWGPPIDTTLHVTVFDRWTGARLAGALVVLGPDASTPLQGWTDDRGQITFSEHGLEGPVMVTASRAGSQVVSLVGVDATNVNVAAEPIPVCTDYDGPCPGADGLSAEFEGAALHPEKGIVLPWGTCEDHPDQPLGACSPCETDADCPADGVCYDKVGEDAFCTIRCFGEGDCPDGFRCIPLNGVPILQCVPSPGDFKVYCDVTNPDLGSTDALPWPGVPASADGTFALPTRLGDYAIFCWSGFESEGVFVPERLGVARGLGAYQDGESVSAEIPLTHHVELAVPVVLDRPDLGPPETETVVLRTFLDLGSEGVLEFPAVVAEGRGELRPRTLEVLSGDLYDATWSVWADVTTSVEPNAASTMVIEGLPRIGGDVAFVETENGWQPRAAFPATTRGLAEVGGESPGVLAVGDGGLVARGFGEGAWAIQPSGTESDLHSVSVAPDGTAFAAGAGGTVLRHDGLSWQPLPTPLDVTFEAVFAAGGSDVWVAGGTSVLRWDGATWTEVLAAPALVRALHGIAPDDVVVAGDGGYVARWKGLSFFEVESGTEAHLRGLWSPPGDAAGLVAVGDGGTVLAWQGLGLAPVPSGTTRDLHAVWGRDAADVFAVGAGGTILRFDGVAWTDASPTGHGASLLAVAGTGELVWAMGESGLHLGPMMAIPEIVEPSQFGYLDHTLAWNVAPSTPAHLSVTTIETGTDPCTICGFFAYIPYRERMVVAEGSIDHIELPRVESIPGTTQLRNGQKGLTVYRAWLGPGFDFHHASANQFLGAGWISWSRNSRAVTQMPAGAGGW